MGKSTWGSGTLKSIMVLTLKYFEKLCPNRKQNAEQKKKQKKNWKACKPDRVYGLVNNMQNIRFKHNRRLICRLEELHIHAIREHSFELNNKHLKLTPDILCLT